MSHCCDHYSIQKGDLYFWWLSWYQVQSTSTLLPLCRMLKVDLSLWCLFTLWWYFPKNTVIFKHDAEVICVCFCLGHCNNIHCLAKAINQIAAALFTIHKGSIEDRLKEFLAVCITSFLELAPLKCHLNPPPNAPQSVFIHSLAYAVLSLNN